MRAQTDERQGPASTRFTQVKLVYFCQVDGCKAKLSNCKPYSQRYRVCPAHLGATCVELHGIPSRFCQQCGKFHPLEEFDGTKRSCRARLQHHNNIRQQRRKEAALQQSLKTAVLLQQHGTRQAVKQHKTIPCTSTTSGSPVGCTSSSSGKQVGSSNSVCTSTTTALELQSSPTAEYASSPARHADQEQQQQQQQQQQERFEQQPDGDITSSDDGDGDDDEDIEEYDADAEIDAPAAAPAAAAAHVEDVSPDGVQQSKLTAAEPSSLNQEMPDYEQHASSTAAAAAAAIDQAAFAENHAPNQVQEAAADRTYSKSVMNGCTVGVTDPAAAAAEPEGQPAVFTGFSDRYYMRCTIPGCADCARGGVTVVYCNVPGCTECPPPPPHIKAAMLRKRQQQLQWTSPYPAAAAGVAKDLSVVTGSQMMEPPQQQQCSSLYGRYRSLTIPDLVGTLPDQQYNKQYNQPPISGSTDLSQAGSYSSPYTATATATAALQGPMLRTYSDNLGSRKTSPSICSSSRFGPLIRSGSFSPASGSCSPAAAAAPLAAAGGGGGSTAYITAIGGVPAEQHSAQAIRPVVQQQQQQQPLLGPQPYSSGVPYNGLVDLSTWPAAASPAAAAAGCPDPQQQYDRSRGYAAMTPANQLSLPARPVDYVTNAAGNYVINAAGDYVSSDLSAVHTGSDLTYKPWNSTAAGSTAPQAITNSSFADRMYCLPLPQASAVVTLQPAAAAVAADLATMHAEDYSSYQIQAAAPAAAAGERVILYGVPEKTSFAVPGSADSVNTGALHSSSMCLQPPPPAAAEMSASRAARLQDWFDANMSAELAAAAAPAAAYEPAKYYQQQQVQELNVPRQQKQLRAPLQLPTLLSRETVARSSPARDFPGSLSGSTAAAAVPLSSIGDLASVGYQLHPTAAAAAAERQPTAASTAAALQQAYVSSLAAQAASIFTEAEATMTTAAGVTALPLNQHTAAAAAAAGNPMQPALGAFSAPSAAAAVPPVASDNKIPGSNPADLKDSGKVLDEYFKQWIQECEDTLMDDLLDPMLSVDSIGSGNIHESLEDLMNMV